MTQVQMTTVLIMGTFVEIGEMLEVSVKPGVSIWRYGAKNSASENFLAPRAAFAAQDNAAVGNYELSDSLERPCSQRTL